MFSNYGGSIAITQPKVRSSGCTPECLGESINPFDKCIFKAENFDNRYLESSITPLKLLCCAALYLCCATPIANADEGGFDGSGTDLLEYCDSEDPVSVRVCINFFRGVIEATSSATYIYKSTSYEVPKLFCVDSETSILDMTYSTLDWMRKNPETLDVPATPIIIITIMRTYPCNVD